MRYSFHLPTVALFIIVTFTTLSAHLLLALAMQEGDASTVVPLLGLKIPFTAILAFLFLDEIFSSSVYVSVVIAAFAVILFGLGKPAKTQGGHDRHPVFGILLAMASALTYSIGDIFVKKALVYAEPLQLILFVNIAMAVPCMGLILLPAFKKYKIKPIDIFGFAFCGLLVSGGIAFYFTFIKTSDNVTIPNIVLATRGFIVLLFGFVLNKLLSISIERQSNTVYVFRLIATCMLFISLVIIIVQR
jgi:drug/metabolite transporter (DMT)-like permease